MAWRIDEAVTHGEIDNTVEGRTTGRIWLLGRAEPLELELDGDCWRDLAGTRLRFENPSPKLECDLSGLAARQKGVVGDITASRKNRVAAVDDDEFNRLHESGGEIPFEWKNTLYLEWFSDADGRVLVESAGYRLEVSPHEWWMDVDAEEAQKLANLNAMRDSMAQVIRRREPSPSDDKYPDELNEFEWEERLKESDRLTDAYQEVLEKYMDDPDSEQKEAFVMGWDGLLDAMADRDEAGDDELFDDGEFGMDDEDFTDSEEDEESDDYEDSEGDPFGRDRSHPLQAEAQELALLAMDVVPGDKGPGTAEYKLVSNLLQVSGKLAGALNDRDSGYEPETGYVLAVLKRCLNWLNEGVAACQQLIDTEEDADQRAALAHIRSTAFGIRDGITELRRQMK
ncbi:MAG TPA: hypothetical protein VLO11_01970 [Luteolibacter sp.]|nr:hypothetical protein [Luteolibacter sp.]